MRGKKIWSWVLLLCLLLPGAVQATTGSASAVAEEEDVAEPYTDMVVYLAAGMNRKNIQQVRRMEDGEPTDTYRLRLTDMPLVQQLPEQAEVSVPLTLLVKFHDYGEDETYEGLVPLVETIVNTRSIHESATVERDVAYFPLSFFNQETLTLEFAHSTGYQNAFMLTLEFDPADYSIANDLVIEFPEMDGVQVDSTKSRPGYYAFTLDEGASIPNDRHWSFSIDGQRVHLHEKRGFTGYTGTGSSYIPPDDEEVLTQYPQLASRSLVTFCHYNKRTKTTHYAVVEGYWPDRNEGGDETIRAY